MKTALPLVTFTMIIGEWGIPQTEQFARDMRTVHFPGGSIMLSVKNGVWAKTVIISCMCVELKMMRN